MRSEYSEGKREPEPIQETANICKDGLLLFIRGNTPISRTEFIYDKRARDRKCLLYIFVFPAQNNVRKQHFFYKLPLNYQLM